MIQHQSKDSFWKNIDFYVKTGKTFLTKTNSYKYLGIIVDKILKMVKTSRNIMFKKKTLIFEISRMKLKVIY